jgi:hypothetical protein
VRGAASERTCGASGRDRPHSCTSPAPPCSSVLDLKTFSNFQKVMKDRTFDNLKKLGENLKMTSVNALTEHFLPNPVPIVLDLELFSYRRRDTRPTFDNNKKVGKKFGRGKPLYQD